MMAAILAPPRPAAGTLVTAHLPDGTVVEGRLAHASGSPFVIDWHRTSRCDNGWRRLPPGTTVHPLMLSACPDPCDRGGPA